MIVRVLFSNQIWNILYYFEQWPVFGIQMASEWTRFQRFFVSYESGDGTNIQILLAKCWNVWILGVQDSDDDCIFFSREAATTWALVLTMTEPKTTALWPTSPFQWEIHLRCNKRKKKISNNNTKIYLAEFGNRNSGKLDTSQYQPSRDIYSH